MLNAMLAMSKIRSNIKYPPNVIVDFFDALCYFDGEGRFPSPVLFEQFLDDVSDCIKQV